MASGIYLNDDEFTYTVTFPTGDDIWTTVTDSGQEAAAWIDDTMRMHRRRLNWLIVGLDIEWRPNQGYDVNMVALIQVCVGRRCLIFQILNSDFIPDQLCDFLMDSRFTFVGVGIQDDVHKLMEDHYLPVRNLVDLRGLAAQKMNRPELRMTGLTGLVREVTGIHMQKPMRVRLSEWDREVLTRKQIKYACADAFASFEVARRLFYNEF